MRVRPPSIPATVFIVFAVFTVLALQQPMLNADGDPARHIRHGLWMLEHHALISADPFSFTRAGAPFLGFEYGSQLLYALAWKVGGVAGVTVLVGLLIAATYALLAWVLLKLDIDPLLAYVVTVAAAALGGGHWVARPHLFSFLATVILLWWLERPRPVGVWLFVPLFALWANLHGGFVFGGMLLAVWLAGTVLEWLASGRNPRWLGRITYLMLAIVCAGLGTLINPHGLELHHHVIEFFGNRFNMDHTAEFLSPNFHEIDGRIFLLGILGVLAALTLHRERPTYPRLLAIVMTLAFGLISVRNMALFGLVALPLTALHVNEAWRRLPDPRGVRGRFALTARSGSTLFWVAPVAVAFAVLAACHGRVGSAQLVADDFDAATFPVAAVAKGRAVGLQGHLFSEFVWGGYLVYAWPEQRIFIDGGTDFFGDSLYQEYSRVRQLSPGWRRILDRWDIRLALLRPKSSLAHELMRDSRWTRWYCDSVAVVLQRTTGDSRPYDRARADSAEQLLSACAGSDRSRSTHAGQEAGD
jgi:hypothetical protein